MRVLVLGAAGMAGHVIVAYLREQGYKVDGIVHKKKLFQEDIICDLGQQEQLNRLLDNRQYDFVINSAGILNEAASKHVKEAIYMNAYLPHYLADRFKGTKTKIIQLSTDCVFSGEDGPYTEDSICNGTTVYDRTKALGELKDSKNLTLRMSIVGPDRNINGIGLFHWFMRQTGKINGYTKAFWTGITTITLAKAIEQAMKTEMTGIYHLVASEPIAKYDLCQLFNKYFKANSIEVVEEKQIRTNKTLYNTRQELIYKVPPYEEMIMEMKDWIWLHRDWYPMYDII